MTDFLYENVIFRLIYCNLSGSSNKCVNEYGYSQGVFPDGFEWMTFLLASFLLAFIFINGILAAVILSIWGERRLYGRFQNRLGPNRWGPWGLFSSIADAIKVMFKEDVVPSDADRLLFNIAPILMVFPVFMIFSVIPMGIGTFVVDLNIGLLFILSVTSMSGLAVVIAAWASGNRRAKPLIEVTERRNKSPMFKSTTKVPIPMGMTEKIIKTGNTIKIGAILNKSLSASEGTTSSLNITFIASAIELNNPQGPQRLGPSRF
jgi:formate hydrogenlyase subunit 4